MIAGPLLASESPCLAASLPLAVQREAPNEAAGRVCWVVDGVKRACGRVVSFRLEAVFRARLGRALEGCVN